MVFNVLGSENPSSKQIYEKMIEKIEKRTEILHFALINVSLPGILLPNLIVSFFIYFTTNFSNDAFRLTYPTWWEIWNFMIMNLYEN